MSWTEYDANTEWDTKIMTTKLTKSKENIEELVEWIVDAMDVSALESFVKENLTDYYNSDEGMDDFQTNYLEMKEIVGD